MDLTDCMFTFKIVLLGGDNVGKSCLIKRYTSGSFQRALATIGVDYTAHYTEVEPGVRAKLQLFDTPGIARAWLANPAVLYKTDGCLLVFDLGNYNSFRHVEYLHKEARKIMHSDTVLFVLVGHKSDHYERKVDRKQAEILADQFKAPYYEVSAKTGDNVAEIFELLARRLYQSLLMGHEPNKQYDGHARSKKSNCPE